MTTTKIRRTRRNKISWIFTAAVITVLIVAGVLGVMMLLLRDGNDGSSYLLSTPYSKGRDNCDVKQGVSIFDKGRTMIVRSEAERYPDGANLDTIECLLRDELDMPLIGYTLLISTTPTDGRQNVSWGKNHATWTYDNRDGLNLVLTRV